ncbi:hypothetical protein [Paenibacillus sp. TC-CSREp1]|uniref:hypothetical protein n=1 Tax=Paenibacillus sp. TC-CSREp1 TaxID=3410089 RepID=UPI003D0135D9
MRIKNMLLVSSMVLSILLMSGCGSEKTPAKSEPAQSTSEGTTETGEKDQVKDVYIDEAGHKGDELEMIKVVNLATKYRNEGNEEEYLKLFNQNNVKTLNSKKIKSLELEDISFMSDDVGTVRTTIQYDNGEEPSIALFIFEKSGDKWIISGTD